MKVKRVDHVCRRLSLRLGRRRRRQSARCNGHTYLTISLSFSLSGLLIDSYLWQSHGRSILFSSFSIFGIVCECDLLPHSVCGVWCLVGQSPRRH